MKQWLLDLFNQRLINSNIHKIWRSHFIFNLKPWTAADDSQKFRQALEHEIPARRRSKPYAALTERLSKGLVSVMVFVHLTGASDTLNHLILMTTLYNLTHEYTMMPIIDSLFEGFVSNCAERARNEGCREMGSSTEKSVLALNIFNIHTTDQSRFNKTFINAEDLAFTIQHNNFLVIENTPTDVLNTRTKQTACAQALISLNQ